MSYTELEELVLKTLSFYDPMTLPKIILSFPNEDLKKHPNFTQENLDMILQNLKKRGLVKTLVIQDQAVWLRTHPPKSLWKKMISRFW